MPTKQQKIYRKRKERNERPFKKDIDLLAYDPLMNKVLNKLAKRHGIWVYFYREELIQEGYTGLMQAYNVYDRERGTFVTIAYLRVWSAMQKFINKEARMYVKTENLEAMKGAAEGKDVLWQDMIPSSEIDYGAVLRLAVIKPKDRELMNHVIGGTLRKDIPKKVGLSIRATKESIERLRDDIIEVCNEMYLGTPKLKARE